MASSLAVVMLAAAQQAWPVCNAYWHPLAQCVRPAKPAGLVVRSQVPHTGAEASKPELVSTRGQTL